MDSHPVRFREAEWDHHAEHHVSRLNGYRILYWTPTLCFNAIWLQWPIIWWRVAVDAAILVGILSYAVMTFQRSANFVRAHYSAPNPDDRSEIGTVQIELRARFGETGWETYGADIGFLTIADGFLHFEGAQTRFSIHRSSFEGADLDLKLKDRGEFHVCISAIPAKGKLRDLNLPTKEVLKAKLLEFLSDRSPVSTPIETVELPPLRPTAATTARSRTKLWLHDLGILAAATFFAVIDDSIVLFVFILICGVSTRSLFSGPIRAFRRLAPPLEN